MKTAALYARVSTRNHQDPETQLIMLRDYARQRDIENAIEYVDVGISGKRDRRPALDRLVGDVKSRRIDVVVVTRFDRFARSTKHMVTMLDEFRSLGVEFISLSESIDTSTPMGKMVFVIIAAVAELERDIIRERIMLGLDRARRDGKELGRPKRVVDRGRIVQLRHQGLSIRKIARDCGVSTRLVQRVLQASGKNPQDNFATFTPA
jgi:DNA invertase Pin-like site-specific DNA recombinase